MDTLSLTKEARIYNGLKTISLTSGDIGKTKKVGNGQWEQAMKREVFKNVGREVQTSLGVHCGNLAHDPGPCCLCVRFLEQRPALKLLLVT